MNTMTSPQKSKTTTGGASPTRPAGTTAAASTARQDPLSQEETHAHEDARGKVSEAMDAVEERASDAAHGVRHAVEDGYRRTVEGASDAYDAAADTVDRSYRHARAGVDEAYRRADWQTRRAGAEVSRYVNDNPLMVSVIGFAGGLLLGALLPWGRRGNGGNESHANRYREAAYSQGDHHRSGYREGYGPYPFAEERHGDYR